MTDSVTENSIPICSMKIPAAITLAVLMLILGSVFGYRVGLNRSSESGATFATNGEKENQGLAVSDQGLPSVDTVQDVAAEDVGLVDVRSFEDRVKAVFAIKSRSERAYGIERLFSDMNAADAPVLLAEMLEWTNSRERRGMLWPFFGKWAELDGPVALEAAESLLGRDKTNSLMAAYAGWAKNDPIAAWDKAEAFLADASPLSAYTVRGAMVELAKVDMDAALKVVSAEKNEIKLRSLNESILEGVFETDSVVEFVAKIGGLEDIDTKKKLLNAVFTRWGENDSADPMEAMSQITDPELAKGAMSGFLAGWANEDREGAIRYALDNKETPLIADSLGELLRNAVMRGGNAENQQLLADVKSAGVLDEVAKELVAGTSFANPRLALEVAESVSDAADRARYQQMGIGSLARTDLDGAISYFQEKVPVEEKWKALPTISWELSKAEEGGSQLLDLYQQIPEGKDRSRMVEALLNGAASPYAKPTEDYLTSLEAIVNEQSGLSENAVENRDKLFGLVTE